MAYIVNKTDGSVLTTVADGSINTTSTNISLIGKNYAGYGEAINENFVRLLENFSANSAPSTPLTGQLWWDKSSSGLKVYDAGWKRVGGATSSATEPTGSRVIGDFWWDTTNSQLKIYSGTEFLLVGPQGGGTGGESGAIVTTITDNINVDHVVLKIALDDSTVAYYSKDAEFTPLNPIPGFISIRPGVNFSTAIANNRVYGNLTGNVTSAGANSFATATISSATDSTAIGNGALVVTGGVGIAQRLNVGGNVSITSGTASSSTSTGALTISGGIGVSGSAYIGSSAYVNTSLGVGLTPPLNAKLDVLGVIRSTSVGSNLTDPGSQLCIWANPNGDSYIAASDLSFHTGANLARTQRMFISSTGDVGIGTATPGYKLHIAQASGALTAGIINAGSTVADTATYYTSASSTSAQITSYGNGSAYLGASASNSLVLGNSANGVVAFYQNNTERARFAAGGFFGIGTTNPVQPFVVSAAGAAGIEVIPASGIIQSFNRVTPAYDTMRLYAQDFVFRTGTGSTITDDRVYITSAGNVSIGTANTGTAGLSLGQSLNISWENSSTESYPNIFRQASSAALVMGFGVKHSPTANQVLSSISANVGKSAIGVENLAIRFFVNTESTVAVGSTVTLVERMNINSAGTLTVTGDVVAFSASDARLKTNIGPIANALDKVDRLSGVEFFWNDDARKIYPDRTKQDVGVIAQEVQAVLPEVVTERADGYLAVNYEKIIPLLIEAIKELRLEIQELKSRQ